MFHALDLAVKILHFAMLSVLQNKPFRSAISNAVFRRLFCKMFKRLALHVGAKKWLKRTYIMNGREREGKKRGEIEKAACSAGAGSVLSAGVGAYAGGVGANASGAGACCERLCETFSVMQLSLPC